MGLYEGRGQLSRIMKELMLRWSETKVQWDDAASRAFEQKHLEPMQRDLQQATAAMDHMAGVLSQLRRECE
jgi:hypothetical protein